MQRTLIGTSSRTCIRCSSDLTSKTFHRSFGKKKITNQTPPLLDPRKRAARLKAAGDKALQDRFDRNAYNKRYRERRKKEKEVKLQRREDKSTKRTGDIIRKAQYVTRRDALKFAKEDWRLGPLAPKRDIGERDGNWGMLTMGMHEMPKLAQHERDFIRRKMGNNEFRAHDRVVLLKGRDKGKIGQILSVNEETMSAQVDGMNKIAVFVEEHMRAADNDPRPYRIIKKEIPLNELKLVYVRRHPETGEDEEVVLNEMRLVKVVVPKAGSTIEIPRDLKNEPLKLEDGQLLERETREAYKLEDYKWKTLRYLPTTDNSTHMEQILAPDPGNPEVIAEIPDTQQSPVLKTLNGETLPREQDEAYNLNGYKWISAWNVPAPDSGLDIIDFNEDVDEHYHDDNAETHAEDTMALSVEEESSFVPEIAARPVPSSVLIELGAFNRKTTQRYSERVETSIREKAEQAMRREMERQDRIRTPLQELRVQMKQVERAALDARKAEFRKMMGEARDAWNKAPKRKVKAGKKGENGGMMTVMEQLQSMDLQEKGAGGGGRTTV